MELLATSLAWTLSMARRGVCNCLAKCLSELKVGFLGKSQTKPTKAKPVLSDGLAEVFQRRVICLNLQQDEAEGSCHTLARNRPEDQTG